MNLTVDLHAHSPYAGASGKTNLPKLKEVMEIKGIDVYGSGDILLEKWEDELSSALDYDSKKEMWKLTDSLFLMPQTEVIVTMPYPADPAKRKLFHLIILFSQREQIKIARKAFREQGSKLSMGRPFIMFDSPEQFHSFFLKLRKNLGFSCAFIPAHIMTPEGILGGKNPVSSLEEIYGNNIDLIDAFESGLSADPDMLAALSDKTKIPVVSFSDAHSAAFNKLGREFTQIKTASLSSEAIVESIKKRQIIKTAEFPPFEGRYYLTGHRGDRPGHNGTPVFFDNEIPEKCPVCSKSFIPGVKERLNILFGKPGKGADFVYQVPLIEIIAQTLNTGVSSKKAEALYVEICRKAGRESNIWLEDTETELSKFMSEQIKESVLKIKRGEFVAVGGFDGEYGKILF